MSDTHGFARIDGRRLRFTAIACQSRVRITIAETEPEDAPLTSDPEALGSVIGLDTGSPGLRISAPLHVEWAVRNAQTIVDEARTIWAAVERDGEG